MRERRGFYQQGFMRSNDHFIAAVAVALLLASSGCKSKTNDDAARAGAITSAPAKTPVPSGPTGTVKGRVHFSGVAVPLQTEPLPPSVQKVCGETSVDRSVVLGSDGALQFAVIAIDAPWASEGAKSTPLIDQRRCSYEPPVLAALAGSALSIRNSDPLIHNVRASLKNTPAFNVAMPLENQTVIKKLPASAGLVKVQCDVHPWMSATIYTFTHTWFAVSGDDGRFEISGVPTGKQTVLLQHPRFPSQSKTVEVPAGADVDVDFEVHF